MKTLVARLLIVCMLVATVVLASFSPPSNYYPAISIHALDPDGGTIRLNFVFGSRPTQAECDRLTANIARQTLKQCPQCRITKLTCDPTLDNGESLLLGDKPLNTPSGRMINGAIAFVSDNPEAALSACQAADALSATTANHVKCYPPHTERIRSAPHSPLTLWSLALLTAAFVSAWLVGWLIIRYEHMHAHFSHDHVDSGPQKYHTQPTPRIGGLAVMVGLLCGGGVMLLTDTIVIERSYGLLLLAGVPAFLGGLTEDITKKVGVLERLLLTMLSGAAAAWLLGATLDRLDISGIDPLLDWLLPAVILTAFAVGGVANSINIIDGYNGLAGGFAVIVLVAMAFIAYGQGDAQVFNVAIALAGAILGFLFWNWPRGRIFFGDGGAYLVGFLLAELSVLLVKNNPDVSPWCPLLLLIYPIFETFYSIYRRKLQHKLSPGQPDNQHLHQLIHDHLVPHQPHGSRFSRNSQVAKYLWGPTIVLAILAVVFSKSTLALMLFAFGFCVFYVVNYRRIARRTHSANSGTAARARALTR